MSDTVAQLLAGAIVLGIGGVGAFVGYRIGLRHGVSRALLLDAEARDSGQAEDAERPERLLDPPVPPTVH